MTIREIVAKTNGMAAEIKQFDIALRNLRGENCINGVEKDERPPVKMLWARLQELNAAYTAWLDRNVIPGGVKSN
jgi:hypothetical protein